VRWVAALVALTACAGRPERQGLAKDWVGVDTARRGELSLSCEPKDAEVFLDGVAQGTCLDFSGTPRGLAVGEGLHRVDVKKRGFLPYQTYYEPSGANASLAPTLQPTSSSQGDSR